MVQHVVYTTTSFLFNMGSSCCVSQIMEFALSLPLQLQAPCFPYMEIISKDKVPSLLWLPYVHRLSALQWQSCTQACQTRSARILQSAVHTHLICIATQLKPLNSTGQTKHSNSSCINCEGALKSSAWWISITIMTCWPIHTIVGNLLLQLQCYQCIQSRELDPHLFLQGCKGEGSSKGHVQELQLSQRDICKPPLHKLHKRPPTQTTPEFCNQFS